MQRDHFFRRLSLPCLWSLMSGRTWVPKPDAVDREVLLDHRGSATGVCTKLVRIGVNSGFAAAKNRVGVRNVLNEAVRRGVLHVRWARKARSPVCRPWCRCRNTSDHDKGRTIPLVLGLRKRAHRSFKEALHDRLLVHARPDRQAISVGRRCEGFRAIREPSGRQADAAHTAQRTCAWRRTEVWS